MFVLFAIFTVLVKTIDVQPIGPNKSEIGFAALNGAVHDAIGTSEFWYKFSERLGYMAILVCAGFGVVGAVQLFKGKSLKAVDSQIVVLGIYYILVIMLYVIFNHVAINYRPVLEADGTLEASYPSSHTVLAVCVFATMFMQKMFKKKGTKGEKICNVLASTLLVAVMLVSRVLSGVHWFTDIIGSIILSTSLVLLYWGVIQRGEGN